MGGIHLRPGELQDAVVEIVGFKAGLVLSDQQIGTLLDEDQLATWVAARDHYVRVRAEDVEYLILRVLKGVGNIEDDHPIPPHMRILASRDDPTPMDVRTRVVQLQFEWVRELVAEGVEPGPRDPTPLLERVRQELGPVGVVFAGKLLLAGNETMHRSPWGRIRRVEWESTEDLDDLFKSESLEALHGEYIDQRFIDYLASNFEDIGRMNWRKFEGLTGEFFHQLGFHVEVGPGRGDGGIDIRVWPTSAHAKTSPPLVVIQCKRQKDDVEQVVVKALWADLTEEDATSGMIVTTSRLAPGARTMKNARAYPIVEINRMHLRDWLEAMRTPFAGYTP